MCSPLTKCSPSCWHQAIDVLAQLGHREGLPQIRDRAVREVALDLLALQRRGHEHDLYGGELGVGPDRVRELKSIHLGHRDVGEDAMRAHALDQREAFASVRREVDLVRRGTQGGLDHLSDSRVIFDEHHFPHPAQASTACPLAASGSRTWKVEPRPTTLSAQTLPPCMVTI